MACERALQRLHQYRDSTRLDSWLYRIVYTQWIDRTRRRQRRASHQEALREVQDSRGEGPPSPGRLISFMDVKKALGQLAQEHRAAILLVAVEGHTYSEAARVLGVPVATLWPLAPGKTAHYVESGKWRDEDNREHTYEAHWRLAVIGQERIRVKAGDFDTWKIVGRRFSAGDAFKPSRLREKRIWYYAPVVGYYVNLEGRYLGRRPDRSIELLAVLPPVADMHRAAQAAFQTSFQQALEEKPSGAALQWNRAELGLSGTTTPTATFKLASGDYCRQYVQHLNRSGEEQVFFGLACRTDAGQWQIPR